ncbi:MAG: hypothetical protein IKP29_04990 [Pseudobutyrivibrio sp.]|nr:hypothetical protein [Pseudobutyrivibrio sp.]
MRRRAARIAALGLSTIALMSTVAFPIRVQAAEIDEPGSPVDMPEEKVAVESVMPSYEQQLADGADAVVTPMLEELPIEIEGEELTEAADGIAAAEDAIENIKGIPGTISSMEEALETYGEASEEYEEAFYEFGNHQNTAINDLEDAMASFNAVQEQLDEMESDVQAKKDALVQAGADVLISAAEAGAQMDTTEYVATIVQYYYAPKTQLQEGQAIKDFNVLSVADGLVTISYNIVDSEGNIVNTVQADYGYTVDSEANEVCIYDNNLVYEYTDSNGNNIRLTEEEAKKVENGFYKLESYKTYKGYIPVGFGWLYGEITYKITENVPVQEKHENAETPVFESVSKEFASYIAGLKEKLSGLDTLLGKIQAAKAAYGEALDVLDELEWEVMSIQPITIGHGSGPIIFDPGVTPDPEPNPDPEIIPEPIVNEQPLPIVSAVKETVQEVINRPIEVKAVAPVAAPDQAIEEETVEAPEIIEEAPTEEAPSVMQQSSESGGASGTGDASEQVQPQPEPAQPETPQVVTIQDEEAPKGVTLAGIMERGKWFIALGGVSIAGAGVGVLEAKRRAAMKILDKLNQ